MSKVAGKKDGKYCERALLGAIGRYDIRKFLVAASASRFGVISEEERTDIFRDGQTNQKINDAFQTLIVEKSRIKNLAAFILEYNGRVQDAALEVLKRSTLTPAFISCKECPQKSSSQVTSSNSSSGTPPSPMDVDTKEYLYSQEGDMPSQHPPDVGYYSDLSKDVSQEHFRHSASNGSNPPQPLYNWEKSTSAKNNHRKHKKVPRYYPGDHVQHQKEQFAAALTTPQMSRPSENKDHAMSERTTAAEGLCSQHSAHKRNGCLWPLAKAHCEVIIQLLNMEALLHNLLKNDLLTQDEYEVIDRYKEMPRKQNRHFLLNVLPRKGKSGFEKFLESLKAEKEHLGHQDLFELLANADK